jgi:hypothetical protein
MIDRLQDDLARHLSDSIAGLQRQAEKVEFWASVLAGVAQPVPTYEPEATAIARYLRPGRPRRKKLHRRVAKRRKAPGVTRASA